MTSHKIFLDVSPIFRSTLPKMYKLVAVALAHGVEDHDLPEACSVTARHIRRMRRDAVTWATMKQLVRTVQDGGVTANEHAPPTANEHAPPTGASTHYIERYSDYLDWPTTRPSPHPREDNGSRGWDTVSAAGGPIVRGTPSLPPQTPPTHPREQRDSTTPPSHPPATEPSPLPGLDGFDRFWQSYPEHRRGGRHERMEAAREWSRLTPQEQETVLSSLEGWMTSNEWTTEDGRFVPSAKNFLVKRRFEHTPKRKEETLPRWIG